LGQERGRLAVGDLRVGVAGLLTGRLPQWYLGQHKDRQNSRAMKHLHSLLTHQCMLMQMHGSMRVLVLLH
jgi:hypothetical protein